MATFWDFCAPFYDFAEEANGFAYAAMLKTVRDIVPHSANVLEIASATGAISLEISDKAASVLCTDISERMLNIARKKAAKRGVKNITFRHMNIFDTGQPDSSFDVVIAGQILHLIDEPEKAAAELRRVAKNIVIIPMSFTKNLHGIAKVSVGIYRLLGFAPKIEFDAEDFVAFLPGVGFENCEVIQLPGKIPMAVAVWKKN
jgi:ubiquinone/menaquinone biosynthesis C-methylase UbiE